MPEPKFSIRKWGQAWVLKTPGGVAYPFLRFEGAVGWFNWYLGSWLHTMGHSEVTVDPPERKIADEG